MTDPPRPAAPPLPQMPARHKAASDDGPRPGARGKLARTAHPADPDQRRMETPP
jgi:hypothetical protein